MLQIFLLGQLQLVLNNRPVPFRARPKTIPLIAYLLLNRDHVTSRDTLAFTLWPDSTEKQARANLRRHLYELRQALPNPAAGTPWLIIEPKSIRWNPGASYWLDVAAFEEMSKSPNRVAQAIELYTGQLLPHIDELWLTYHRERLHLRYLNNLQQLIARHRKQREYDQALNYVQQLLDDDPLREDIVRELMTLRYALGDRPGALNAYQEFVDLLHDELGVPPMTETTALHTMIGQQKPLPDLLIQPAVDDVSPEHEPMSANLPIPFYPLIGRENELAIITKNITDSRLVTITGPGGVGKTRLAIAVAHHLIEHHPDRFPDGIFFIPLAPLQDPALIIPIGCECARSKINP